MAHEISIHARIEIEMAREKFLSEYIGLSTFYLIYSFEKPDIYQVNATKYLSKTNHVLYLPFYFQERGVLLV